MSTDLYGIRVLDVALDDLRVEFAVFVVYYDTSSRTCPALPDDPGFFLHLLWERARGEGPLGQLITVDQILDDDWVNTHARWFIDDVERISTRNHPPTEEDFARLPDFSYERAGGWAHEDLLVQAVYRLRVTDARWLEPLKPLDSWGTTSYPMAADRVRSDDAPHVPDLRHRTVTLTPFEDLPEEAGTPGQLAFSDDSRFLAVTSAAGELVVYRTDGWTLHDRADPGSGLILFPHLTWVPGKHTVALTDYCDEAAQWTYDVAVGSPVTTPLEPGRVRSRTGRYRVEFGEDYWVDFVNSPPVPDWRVPDGAVEEEFIAEGVVFTADESRMFVGGMGSAIYVIDPAAGRVVDTIADVGKRAYGLAVSPDGAYLAGTVETDRYHEPREYELCVWRVADHEVVTRYRGGPYGGPLAWSPDGRWLAADVTTGDDGFGGETRIFPIGLPTDPPAAFSASDTARGTG